MAKVKTEVSLKVEPILDEVAEGASEVAIAAPVAVEVPAPAEVLPAVAEAPRGLTRVAADPELKERIQEAVETLSQFDDMKLPVIRMTDDGFELYEGMEPVESFTGILIATKRANVYFEGRYKPGTKTPPRCSSPDGITPDTLNPISPTCKECPMNQFGSDGEAKPCKNTRPMFILVDNPDSEGLPIIPKVLRISPTSLKAAQTYGVNLAADFGALYSVRTRFLIWKKEESQKYFNIKFGVAGKVTPQEKANAKAITDQWMNYIRVGQFGLDVMDLEPEVKDITPVLSESQGEVSF